MCHCERLERVQISDFSVYVDVRGKLDALASALDFFVIDLDNTDHWLTIDLWIVINDDVQTEINGDNTCASQRFHIFQFVRL